MCVDGWFGWLFANGCGGCGCGVWWLWLWLWYVCADILPKVPSKMGYLDGGRIDTACEISISIDHPSSPVVLKPSATAILEKGCGGSHGCSVSWTQDEQQQDEEGLDGRTDVRSFCGNSDYSPSAALRRRRTTHRAAPRRACAVAAFVFALASHQIFLGGGGGGHQLSSRKKKYLIKRSESCEICESCCARAVSRWNI